MLQRIEVPTGFQLSDYDRYAGLTDEVARVRKAGRAASQRLAGRKVWIVNSTATGGGVAEMLLREVALLREVHRSHCGYLWSHHIPIALHAGLTEFEIEDIRSGRCVDGTDQAVIQAVDDLTCHSTISQATWDLLGELFTEQQCMDLTFTIGGYLLLALAVNTFGIQEEHG